jgi:hypothetical protein
MVAHRVEPDHGTRARYVHRTLACHCPRCTAANTAYIARYRRDKEPWQPRTWHQQALPFAE